MVTGTGITTCHYYDNEQVMTYNNLYRNHVVQLPAPETWPVVLSQWDMTQNEWHLNHDLWLTVYESVSMMVCPLLMTHEYTCAYMYYRNQSIITTHKTPHAKMLHRYPSLVISIFKWQSWTHKVILPTWHQSRQKFIQLFHSTVIHNIT